jgi:uncharacterized phiE125 gp8 family phage protein
MSLVLTAAPAVEPITLADAKAQLRVDGTSEDAFIASLIVTSRLQIEAALGMALITQAWRWTLDAWPAGQAVELPIRPVQSVDALKVSRADGTQVTVPPSQYHVDGAANPARIVYAPSALPMPGTIAQGIAVELTAGFGPVPADVPPPVRQALMMLVAHWFENREPVVIGAQAVAIPETVSSLLAPYRQVRL